MIQALPSVPDSARWAAMPLRLQMANIASEVGRTANWMEKGNEKMAFSAFVRALDLVDLTVRFGRKGSSGRDAMLTELLRSRDLFAQAFCERDITSIRIEERYYTQFAKNRVSVGMPVI